MSEFGQVLEFDLSCSDTDYKTNPQPPDQVCYIYNDGLGLLKLADTSLILIDPSPSNVNNCI